VNFSGATLVGVAPGDVVTLDYSAYLASFDTKNVGAGKPVTVIDLALGGADAGNYTLTQPLMLTADITPAGLTVDGAAADNKVYDGTTAATVDFTGASLVGIIAPMSSRSIRRRTRRTSTPRTSARASRSR